MSSKLENYAEQFLRRRLRIMSGTDTRQFWQYYVFAISRILAKYTIVNTLNFDNDACVASDNMIVFAP